MTSTGVVYSEYVSLGINCEGAYQIRRVLGRDSASFFSWNVTPPSALESLIRSRFKGILGRENISAHGDGELINDRSHRYKFHSPFGRPDFENDPNLEAKLADHRQKTDYLIARFLRLREPNERTAYFYKADGIEESKSEWRAIMGRVRDLIRDIHGSSDFVLVILQDEKDRDAIPDEDHLAYRFLKRFSPWYDATDGHVQSWDSVFREFPYANTMHLAGY